MSDNVSEVLKQKGNQELKNNYYDKAIRLYTEAIEYDQFNPKLYSNRCTAYLLLRNFDSALEDAKKCVSLDPDWSKGYIQKGSCYAGMHKYKDALAEYNKALEKSDDKSSVEKLIKEIETKMSKNNFKTILFGDSIRTLNSLENILRILILLGVLFSIIPFPRGLRSRFSRVLYVSYFCLLLIHIYRTQGRPRLSMTYWSPILRDSLVCYAIPLVLFRSTPFAFIPILIILLHEMVSLCQFIHSICVVKAPSFAEKMESALGQAMVKVTQDNSWYSRTPTEKEYMIREIMGLCCASFEVSLVIPSLFSLKNGIRGLYMILMVVQYLIYRNGVDSYVARTIQSYDVTINRFMYSPKCPGFLRTIYGKIRGLLSNMSSSMFRRQSFVC